MSPRHSLAILVAVAAIAVAVMWFALFRRHVLTPPVTLPAGPTLLDIGRQFDQRVEAFNKLIPSASVEPTPPPSAASDDVQALVP